jgi:hypothetical protein
MRTHRRKLLLAALLVLGIAAIILGIAYLGSPREPSYEGKTLSAWIAPFCRQTTTNLDAPAGPQHFEELQPTRRAVSQIGTNALPFLIARLNHRESAFHRSLRELSGKQPLLGLRLNDPRGARIRAIRALAILGPAARPAIPSLVAQLPDPILSEHAVYALSGMGPDGIRALIDHLTNAAPSGRVLISMTLAFPNSMYRGENVTDTNQIPNDLIVEGLSRIIQDSASPFRIAAIQRLGMLGPAASNAVPALLAMATGNDPMKRMAIQALGETKSQPDLVVQVLTNLLSDPDPSIRMITVSTLRAFGYNAQFQPYPNQFRTPGPPYVPGRTNRFVPPDRYRITPPQTNSR